MARQRTTATYVAVLLVVSVLYLSSRTGGEPTDHVTGKRLRRSRVDAETLPIRHIDRYVAAVEVKEETVLMARKQVIGLIGGQTMGRVEQKIAVMIGIAESEAATGAATRIGSLQVLWASWDGINTTAGLDTLEALHDASVVIISPDVVHDGDSAKASAIAAYMDKHNIPVFALQPEHDATAACPQRQSTFSLEQEESTAHVVSFGKESGSLGSDCTWSSSMVRAIALSTLETAYALHHDLHLTTSQMSLLLFFVPLLLGVLVAEAADVYERTRKRLKYLHVPQADTLDDVDMELSSAEEREESEDVSAVPPLVEWYRTTGRPIGHSFLVYAIVLCLCSYFDESSRGMMPFGYHLRQHDLDSWGFLMILVLVFSLSQLKTIPEDLKGDGLPNILSREMTEEWKGMMQLGFLLYHYFHTSETYNYIRVFIACYVWMTGYGNFSFFRYKKDFSIARVVRMTWRINLFVLFLSFAMNNEYMEYYICPLHTFYFYLVYLAMLPLDRSISQYLGNRDGTRDDTIVFGCLAVSFIGITLLFESDAVWNLVNHPWSFLYLRGSLQEWYFRSHLDHYATWFGMCVAAFLPYWRSYLKWVDTSSRPVRLSHRATLVGVCLFSGGLYVVHNTNAFGKYEFNALHPYMSWLPIAVFIVLRNLTPALRTKYMSPPAWMGRITLETYLLQYHIWLSDNAKMVVDIVPGFPWINFLLVSIFFIFVSNKTFEATAAIINALVPRKPNTKTLLLRNTAAVTYFALCCGIATAMESARSPLSSPSQ